MTTKSSPTTVPQVASALRSYALSLPGAHEDFPWGERVVKVGSKVFVFLGHADQDRAAMSAAKLEHAGARGRLSLGVKLPHSGADALSLPGVKPTAYGLGKHGWVSGSFEKNQLPPVAILIAWIEESYRAVAPAKLIAQMETPQGTAPPKRTRSTTTPASKKPR